MGHLLLEEGHLLSELAMSECFARVKNEAGYAWWVKAVLVTRITYKMADYSYNAVVLSAGNA